jgi:hypothetical protein
MEERGKEFFVGFLIGCIFVFFSFGIMYNITPTTIRTNTQLKPTIIIHHNDNNKTDTTFVYSK